MPNGIAFAFLLQTDKRCIKIIITNPKFITDSRPRKLFLQHLFIQIIKIKRANQIFPATLEIFIPLHKGGQPSCGYDALALCYGILQFLSPFFFHKNAPLSHSCFSIRDRN